MTATPLKAVPDAKPKPETKKRIRKRAKLGTVRFLTKTLIVAVAALSMVAGTLWYRMDVANARAIQLATQIDHVFVDRAVAAIIKKEPKVPEDFARELVWTVIEISMRYNIDARIALGKIGVESNFNKLALGASGEIGLTQVMPRFWLAKLVTAGIIKEPADLLKMRESIEAGMYVLSQYIKQSRGDYRKALAFYNAGPGGDAGDYPDQVARYASRF